MSEIKRFFGEIFQEDNGGYSSTRALFITWFIVQLIVWAIICIYQKAMVDFPPVLAGLDTAWLGAKVWQKREEIKFESKPATSWVSNV